MQRSLGTYIHIPFCPYKCYFCDFVTSTRTDELQEKYCHILSLEIKERLAKLSNKPSVNSIFYGGGTPGILQPEHFNKVHQSLLSNIDLVVENEVTLETTPETITKEKAKFWFGLGINRLSIGIQSFQNEELRTVGRGHTAEQAFQAICDAVYAGFQNINCDLIYGLPGQDLNSWQKSVSKFIEISKQIPQVRHLSAYALELSPTAPLSKMFPAKSTIYATEQEYEQQHLYLLNSLPQAGFHQYEISNFAKIGYQSKHNLNYWQEGEYLAFGVSSHRYLKPYRSSNWRSLDKYIEDYLADETCELIDENIRRKEAIMLGFRMTNGIDLIQFKHNHGLDLLDVHSELITRLQSHSMLIQENNNLRLTPKGQTVANLIISEFL